MSDLLTLDEAAQHLRVTPEWLRRVAGRDIPARKVGRRWMFTREDIDTYLERVKHDALTRDRAAHRSGRRRAHDF